MNLIRLALGIDADLRNFDNRYTELGKLVLRLEQRCADIEFLIESRKTLLSTRARRRAKKLAEEQKTDG